MIDNSLFQSIPAQSPENQNPVIPFINVLEGFKTKIKNLHWASPKGAKNLHLQLDELLEAVQDYQDSLAEESSGMYGTMRPDAIEGVKCDCLDAASMLVSLKQNVVAFYVSLNQNVVLNAGLRSVTEAFIHTLNREKHLFTLCE
jgi:hypothetical protein